MKGLVFTELIQMVEDKFGYDTLKKVLDNANLPHKGIYVSGGTYPHAELLSIVMSLNKITNTPIKELLIAYGKHMQDILIQAYPMFAEASKNPIDYIASVENYIHVEVRKLYPEAELPTFTIIEQKPDRLVIHYKSSRKMEDFAYGMMLGCAAHYQMPLDIKYEPISNSEIYTVQFDIRMMTAAEVAQNKSSQKVQATESKGLWNTIKSLLGI